MPTLPDPRRPELTAARALAIAAATAHDAVRAHETLGIRDGQMALIRAAAAMLEIAQDHPAAADYGPSATADELLREILGLSISRQT